MVLRSIEDIRRANLNNLISQYGGPVRFSELIGIAQAQISQWASNAINPTTGRPRNISSGSCRRIESVLELEQGWFDSPHEDYDASSSLLSKKNTIRQENIQFAINFFSNGKQSNFAKKLEISQAQISQWLNGQRNISESSVENIEGRLSLPRNWLSAHHGSYENAISAIENNHVIDQNTEIGNFQKGSIPLISWVTAGAWAEAIEHFSVDEAEEWLPCPVKHGARAYALRVRGISMEPLFNNGDIIYVDPDIEPTHGKNVVVRIENEREATFKQLVIDGDRKFLRPLNPDWPDKIIEINGEATICGVVIGKFVKI